jgi:hypothetical protein
MSQQERTARRPGHYSDWDQRASPRPEPTWRDLTPARDWSAARLDREAANDGEWSK